MSTLLRSLSIRELLIAEAPSLAISMMIAELFFKFHSFTLECIAFLATWYVVGSVIRGVVEFFQTRSNQNK